MKRTYNVTVKELIRMGREMVPTLRSDMGFRVVGCPPSTARKTAREMFLGEHGEKYFVKACSGKGHNLVLYVVEGKPDSRPEPGLVFRKPPATPRPGKP